ncbi:type IV secretion system protein TraC [Chromobacterium sp. IIBBL 290-4]|uniref:type IV secretion system protein TraC n=1 Tax=Chromobacterium sp. IIBBL 290-4 TaxID=2953890 RepID=UPI0020B64109|nr:type IV secretion system protein TraC [Chromobacterium sp. IIBBL 290-4]UTH74237.1 type IV secretion system protein TraC [Chromobacterium sp. IIBBL 290-4]
MAIATRVARAAERFRASEAFPLLCYDEETHSFVSDDGFLCRIFHSQFLTGCNDETRKRIAAALSIGLPDGALVSFHYLMTPNISGAIGIYARPRRKGYVQGYDNSLLEATSEKRIEFFRQATEAPVLNEQGSLLMEPEAIICLKIPCQKNKPQASDFKEFVDLSGKFESALRSLDIQVESMDEESVLRLLRRCFNPYLDHGDIGVDPHLLLREQILSPGQTLNPSRKTGESIVVESPAGQNHIRVLSPHILPEHMALARMMRIAGDPAGMSNQIKIPFMVTTCLHFPDQAMKKAAIKTKAAAINWQYFGPTARIIPILGLKKRDFDLLSDEIARGGTMCEMFLTITLWGRSEEEVSRQAGGVQAIYSDFNLQVQEEARIRYEMFWNSLPGFVSGESMSQCQRWRTMSVKQALNFLPLLGEWRGTGTGGAIMLHTRRNSPFMLDFYDSPTAYSFTINAESGAGKSVLANHIIESYLSQDPDTRVYVIDDGWSYYKLAQCLGGEFIAFKPDSDVCLNPFTNIVSLEEEMDGLVEIVAKMAAPTDLLGDYERARIREGILASFQARGTAMTVTDIYGYLRNQDNESAIKLGEMLHPFTQWGDYGRWFEGENSLDLSKRFMVLEMKELGNRKHLAQVVLFALMLRVSHEMYVAGLNAKKLLLVDEAWEKLDDPMAAGFMAALARKVRKEKGALGVITQKIDDLYHSKAGMAIAANSPFRLVLAQRPESIASIETERLLELDPYGFQLMRSVHTVPGRYSEVMVIGPGGEYGVARLIVDRFTQVLYSTKDAERNVVIEAMERGQDPKRAIEEFIEHYG